MGKPGFLRVSLGFRAGRSGPVSRLEAVDKSVTFRLGTESGPLKPGKLSEQAIEVVPRWLSEARGVEKIRIRHDNCPAFADSAARNGGVRGNLSTTHEPTWRNRFDVIAAKLAERRTALVRRVEP